MSQALREDYWQMSENYGGKLEIQPTDTDQLSDDQGIWLNVAEAADKLGITENALRVRIHRNKARSRKSNDGSVLTWVPYEILETNTETQKGPPDAPEPVEGQGGVKTIESIREGLQDALLASHESRIADLKASHEREIVTLREQMAWMRADLIEARKQAEDNAEMRALRDRHRELLDLTKALVGRVSSK
jgi:hypothetical protein